MSKDWTDQQIEAYYAGIRHSDYPAVFWNKMLPYLRDCTCLIDVGSGPGAFSLQALAAGFSVLAVDSNVKNLRALERQVNSLGYRERCKTVVGDWLEVEIQAADAVICAYSMGGSVGSLAGIKKSKAMAKTAMFFIAPFEKTCADFKSRDLYDKTGIAPVEYGGDYRDVLAILETLGLASCQQIIEYDFGSPVMCDDEQSNVHFLMEKLNIPDFTTIRAHYYDILEFKNGMLWLPNPKKGVLIICLLKEWE